MNLSEMIGTKTRFERVTRNEVEKLVLESDTSRRTTEDGTVVNLTLSPTHVASGQQCIQLPTNWGELVRVRMWAQAGQQHSAFDAVMYRFWIGLADTLNELSQKAEISSQIAM